MLSRVAESLYWLGRYAERAENTARIINVNANLLLDLPSGIAPGWAPLVAITGHQEEFDARHSEADERSVLRFLLSDPESPCSILASLRSARENARTVIDILPREAWELLNELYNDARAEVSSGVSKRGRHGYLKKIERGVQTLSGVLLGTMNHDEGYYFLTIGRFIERGDMTSRIIDVRSSSLVTPEITIDEREFENVQWRSVLKSMSAYQMYRRTMHSRISRRNVMKFLLQDIEFPRSIARCANLAGEGVEQLPNHDGPRRAIASLQRAVSRADTEVLALQKDTLHEFIDDIQAMLSVVHDEVANAWFLHEPT